MPTPLQMFLTKSGGPASLGGGFGGQYGPTLGGSQMQTRPSSGFNWGGAAKGLGKSIGMGLLTGGTTIPSLVLSGLIGGAPRQSTMGMGLPGTPTAAAHTANFPGAKARAAKARRDRGSESSGRGMGAAGRAGGYSSRAR
jgi:hypothetical protein